MIDPQSPPPAPYRWYPRTSVISFCHSSAMRRAPSPVVVSGTEKPAPGSDGTTTSKASAGSPAIGPRIGQRPDDVLPVPERPRPAVRQDQRPGTRPHALDVEIMNRHP